MNYRTFETDRLFIRPTVEEDAAFILELLNTPKWIQFVGDRKVHTEADAQNYIRIKMMPQLERLGYSNNTVILKEGMVKIGVCGLYDREGLDGVDIGFAFLPDYEGKGYAYEASSRVVRAAREDFGITSIKAITIEENASSRRLLERLGLKFQQKMFLEGDPVELMLYEMNLKMKICVYCASSAQIDQKYFEATETLAREFVKQGVEVVYGGGAIGLMGKLADTVLEEGGKIKGIMPQFMNEIEWAHKKVSDFEFTRNMHERKARFLEGIDGVVALAGGTGTLEELLEAITLKRLGQFTKPIIILNTAGFYDPLKQMLQRCVDERFMDERHLDLWCFVDEPGDVLDAIRKAAPWDTNAIHFATKK